MPYKNKADRKYKNAAIYEDSPEQVKNREARNKARRTLAKKGVAIAGKDVAHVKALSKGGSNADGLKVESKSGNRSFSRNADHSLKSEVSKRERKKK